MSIPACITDYSLALSLLDQYDHQQLRLHGTTETARFDLTHPAAMDAVSRMKVTMGERDGLFGRERDKGLESAIGAVTPMGLLFSTESNVEFTLRRASDDTASSSQKCACVNAFVRFRT